MALHAGQARPYGTRPLLVGRKREQELLHAAFDEIIEGRGSLVLVSGEAGIGKTTLVQDLVHHIEEHGALILSGGCYDLTTTPPYGPWVEASRAQIEAEASPVWQVPGTAGEQRTSQADLFDEVQRFFGERAARRPLVIVLEDLHWADQASLELLRHLGRDLNPTPILIIATYRDDEIDRDHPLFSLLPLLIRESRATRIDLKALDAAALDDLLQEAYALTTDDRTQLARTLLERTDGNPLFVREILHTMEYQGILQPGETGWELGDLASVDVPPLILQHLEARLMDVSDQTRSALEIAAVIGQEIPFDLWQTLTDPTSDMVAIAREASAARIIENSAGSHSMRFRHALVRQALYDSLILPQRRVMHRHVAEALLATANPDPSTVAHHLEMSGDERAADWLIRAGGRAERFYAPLVALEQYERAVDALEQFPERDRERGWLMHRIARLYRWHDPDQSLPYLRKAAEIAQQIGDQTLEAYTRFDLGLLRRFVGDIPGSLDQMIAGVQLIDALPIEEWERSAATISPLFAEAIPDNTQSGYAGVAMPGAVPGVNLRKPTLSWLLAGCGRFDEAEAMAASVIQELHDAGVEREQVLLLAADAFRALGTVHAVRGRPEEARYHFQMAREAAIAKDDHQWIAVGAMLEVFLVNLVYETEQVDYRKTLERIINQQLGTFSAIRPWLDPPTPDEFQVLFTNGCWREARALALRYLRESPPRPPLAERGRAISILAELAHRQGRREEAKQWIARLFPQGPSPLPNTPLFFIHERAQRVAVEVALDDGDLESAGRWLDAREAWLDSIDCVIGRPETELLGARIQLLQGNTEVARERARDAYDRASAPAQPRALLAIDRFLGELEMAQGNTEQARKHTEQALSLAERCELPDELALSRLAHAEVLAASGDPQAARLVLDDVLPVLSELDARPLIARAEALSKRVGATMKRNHYPDGLSAREVEVLQAVARGLTNAEIADELFISARTVGSHITSIYRKLGLNSRAAATRFAFESGLTSEAADINTTSID